MIDLTPLDIRRKKGDFSRGLRGYDSQEVDTFLDMAAERLEELVRDNLSLRERVAHLSEKVEGQEGRERAVQEALVTAQALREEITGQARREAELIRQEAEAESRRLWEETDSATRKRREDSESAALRILEEAEAMSKKARGESEAMSKRTQEEAEAVTRSAREEADKLARTTLENLDRRKEDAEVSLRALERQRVRFLRSFRALLENELDALTEEEASVPVASEADLKARDRPSNGEVDSGETAAPTSTDASTSAAAPTSTDASASRGVNG